MAPRGKETCPQRLAQRWGRRHLGLCPDSDPSSAEQRADPDGPQLPLVFSRTHVLQEHCVGCGTRQEEAVDLHAAFPNSQPRWDMAAAFGAKTQYFSKRALQKFLRMYVMTKADLQGGTCSAVSWVPAPTEQPWSQPHCKHGGAGGGSWMPCRHAPAWPWAPACVGCSWGCW